MGFLKTEETLPGFQHVAEFTGLVPETLYRCSVPGFESFSLLTPPLSQERKFAIIGHTGGDARMDVYPGEFTAAQILVFDPDFTLHAGDCVLYSDPKSWKTQFFRLFKNILRRAPVFVSPGNHDAGAPFLEGYDLRCFKEVLPYGFPEEVDKGPAQAFYHVRQGPVDLYFLSYMADMDAGSVQMKWLKGRLAESQATFRIVVYGGSNKYYDRPATLAFLGSLPIDLIVNGDGGKPAEWLDKTGPIPILRAGSGAGGSRSWLACRATHDRLTLQLMHETGAQAGTHWIHRKRRERILYPLSFPEKSHNPYWMRYTFMTEWVEGKAQPKGLQIRFSGLADGQALCSVVMQPEGKLKGNEAGFPLHSAYFSSEDSLLTFTFPLLRPMTTDPMKWHRLHFRVIGLPRGSEFQIEEAWLF